MRANQKLSTKNVAAHAWRAGFRGVTGLAASLGVNRVSVYRAIRTPNRHRPTFRRIEQALNSHGTHRI